MINKVAYQHRIIELSELDNLLLPNAFKVYIQCRTQVVDPISTDIYCFESRNSQIYVTGKTLLDITIFDYSTFMQSSTLRDAITTMLNEHGVQMKMCFISKL